MNNYDGISMSVRDVARDVIHPGKVVDGLLNTVEMAFRAYDPCFACATNNLPGQMPMEVGVRRADGTVARKLSR